LNLGNANLQIGVLRDAIQENGAPKQRFRKIAKKASKRFRKWRGLFRGGINV